jgi:hypothetical protein
MKVAIYTSHGVVSKSRFGLLCSETARRVVAFRLCACIVIGYAVSCSVNTPNRSTVLRNDWQLHASALHAMFLFAYHVPLRTLAPRQMLTERGLVLA